LIKNNYFNSKVAVTVTRTSFSIVPVAYGPFVDTITELTGSNCTTPVLADLIVRIQGQYKKG